MASGFGLRLWKLSVNASNIAGVEHMSDIEHDIVGAPMLEKCLQLVLNVLGLLSRQSRDRVVAVKSLCGYAVTVLAVGYLSLQFAFGHSALGGSFRHVHRC